LGQSDCRGGSTNELHYFVFRGHAKRLGFRRGFADRKPVGTAWIIKDGVHLFVEKAKFVVIAWMILALSN
jgi:hypothetical protein